MEKITAPERLNELLEPFTGIDTVTSRGVTMNYSLGGEPTLGTVLLVAGLAMHRSDWAPELIDGLRRAGYATLTADNRDCGHTRASTPTRGAREYGLQDLATDLRDLVVALGRGPVHVLGMSMGGMIAQHVALLAPELALSLTSLMSTTGHRNVGRPHDVCKWLFTEAAPTSGLDAYLAYARRREESVAAGYVDLGRARWHARVAWRRGIRPEGTARQLAAIRADGDRSDRLARLQLPTLVIHGDADPMIDVSGGVATAEAIPDAELVIVPHLGHSVPWQLADGLTERIVRHLTAATRQTFRR